MIEPDDFGLSAIQTLSHVGDSRPAPGHGAFWSKWAEALDSLSPTLTPRIQAHLDPSNTDADYEFVSTGNVSIGCRLLRPAQPPAHHARAAGVVVVHGARNVPPLAAAEQDWEPLARQGISVLFVCLRGFPGSQTDTGDLTASPFGWVTHGLESDETWVLPRAAADIVASVRAFRRHLGPRSHVSIAGESLGAALAILAAAFLCPRHELCRVVLSLPSFGDWPWRLAHSQYPSGAQGLTGQILAFSRQMREEAGAVLARARLADPVVHARHVTCPVLCKLALRDDVNPAPAAAAVFNALGCSGADKLRFLTPYGHFDGGLRNARRHALFHRFALEFANPEHPLEQLRDRWTPVLNDGSHAPPSLIPQVLTRQRPAPLPASAPSR